MSELHQAVAPGHPLWIVPHPRNCWWSREFNWKLNFQILAGLKHQAQKVSAEVTEIVLECQLPFALQPPVVQPNLLIPSSQLLPNRWVLVSLGDWTQPATWKEHFNQWKKLGSPAIRIFLPTEMSQRQAIDFWHRLDPKSEAEIVFIEDQAHG